MNMNKVQAEINIARKQAAISSDKSNYWKAEGHEYKTLLYLVRAKALNAYVEKLIAKIQNHKKIQYKKANRNEDSFKTKKGCLD
jgi:hypothetical protein